MRHALNIQLSKIYCNLIDAATIVASRTSLVNGCDKTLFIASTANNNQKVSGVKRVSNARLVTDMVGDVVSIPI